MTPLTISPITTNNTWTDTVQNYIYNISLPLWGSVGVDKEHGGFIESLDFSTNTLTHDKRLRVHGRQTFIMLYLLRNKISKPPLPYSSQIINNVVAAQKFLENYQSPIQDIYYTLVGPKGKLLNNHITPYDHAFLLMGFSELALATSNSSYFDKAERIWRQLEKYFQNNDGTFAISATTNISEPLLVPLHSKQEQNHHMHLFEACISLYQSTNDEIWKTRADAMYKLFKKYFFNTKETLLHEFFLGNWQVDKVIGQQIQAGHYYEWVWLLTRYQNICGGEPSAIKTAKQLYEYANKYGVEVGSTFATDEMLPKGEPLRTTKRLWVQAEALKAHVSMLQLSQSSNNSLNTSNVDDYATNELNSRVEAHIGNIFKHYLQPNGKCNGVWFDQMDEKQDNISQNAPASTAYHILLALHEYLQIQKRTTLHPRNAVRFR